MKTIICISANGDNFIVHDPKTDKTATISWRDLALNNPDMRHRRDCICVLLSSVTDEDNRGFNISCDAETLIELATQSVRKFISIEAEDNYLIVTDPKTGHNASISWNELAIQSPIGNKYRSECINALVSLVSPTTVAASCGVSVTGNAEKLINMAMESARLLF